MANFIINGEYIKTADNTEIAEVSEENGISFGCRQGSCGSCEVTVLEGMENLQVLSDAETTFGLDEGNRLASQCVISEGTVSIKD